jgi:hypothetical protein
VSEAEGTKSALSQAPPGRKAVLIVFFDNGLTAMAGVSISTTALPYRLKHLLKVPHTTHWLILPNVRTQSELFRSCIATRISAKMNPSTTAVISPIQQGCNAS